MNLVQAKEFVFREHNDISLLCRAEEIVWSEHPDRFVARFHGAGTFPDGCVRLTLEAGIHEVLCPISESPGHYTIGVEFDRIAGWDRQCASKWLEQRLQLRNLNRATKLKSSYRLTAPFASWLKDFGLPDELVVPTAVEPGKNPVSVEFVPVPDVLGEPGLGRRTEGTRPSRKEPSANGISKESGHLFRKLAVRIKNGGDLELDLAETRQRQRLPADWAAPTTGIINPTEAKMIVRQLERALTQTTGSVGVIALFPSQVELIRFFLQQSPAWATARDRIVVGGPEVIELHEVDTLIFGLTRSHYSRAMPFNMNDPSCWLRILLRCRRKVIFVGDVGTLTRRSEWRGALDPQDETAARIEKDWVSLLVAYLYGSGPQQDLFRLYEGGRS
jgi:hypothetical protein